MKKVLLVFVSLAIYACASQGQGELHLPQVKGIEERQFSSIPVFKEHNSNISKPEFTEFMLNVPEKETPLLSGYMCGGYLDWDGLIIGQQILEEADLVLDLKHVKEIWVPIEGEPKKLYVFEVR
ncbi:hypothetical protein [Microbulbifer spongiae]|uniref:Pilus assembly protein PilP n=1 Tax=Microbulbifer spongiae TaxID=2944933 RepID=A0ABY9EFF5_9GAMM|nr:hypothetical protein [Microbulbifer sp. MI-G]WKD51684.1 hypothetical protein M8T91_18690 [Microbulbifer sp. MI-G]